MGSANNQLAPHRSGSTVETLRSVWRSYQNARPAWHVVVPLGLGGIAVAALNWAWTMLDRNEYGAAMLLVLFFVLIGIGAAVAIPTKFLRWVALLSVVLIAGFSVIKTWQEKGDKPWTAINFSQPTASPSPTPTRPQIVMPITTTYRGLLVPGNEATPSNACSRFPLPPDSLLVLFGNQAAYIAGYDHQRRSVIIRIGGEDVLAFTRQSGEIALDSTIRHESGEVVARIESNEFKLVSNEDYYMERPDAHTLMVVSPSKAPVLYVKYLNRAAIEFRGIFHYPNRKPLSVRSGVYIPEYRWAYEENCWEMDKPIFDLR